MFIRKSPFPFPKKPVSKIDIALTLASGIPIVGTYVWKKIMDSRMKDAAIPMPPVSDPENQPFTSSSDDEPYPFGSMDSDSGERVSLKSVKVTGHIDGLLFSSTIRQEYKNETDKALEIIYTFPLGWNMALLGMDATIGDKTLHGELVKKVEAEEQYEEAIEKGHSAIMLQQSSTRLYTANLGNIKPGENVSIKIHCAKLLNYEQGRIRIAIPTVIGERYGIEHAPGGLAPHETAKVDMKANYSFDLELTIHGDMTKANIECPTHKITKEASDNAVTVKLDSGASLDRDFILLLANLSEESHALYAQDQDKWMATASFCPHMDNVDDNPLALKILVDCSGSMSGMSIQQAQKGLQKILKLLTDKDYVSYSRFGSNVQHLFKTMLKCDQNNLAKLFVAIDSTNADMGGTEMENAVLSTVKDIKDSSDLPPVMLLITDGDIWNVQNLIESAKKTGHRIFVMGVGAAPVESVLMDLAIQTGGVCEFVTPNENMADAIVRMFHRMRGKTAKNIQVKWDQAPVWQSALPRYIYDNETVHTFALFDKRPEAGPVLSWEVGGKAFSARIKQIEETDNFDLVRLGRRVQMQESLTDQEKVAIALNYGLISNLTSFILVYKRAEDDKVKGLPKIQQVPQMPAYGHGNYVTSKVGIMMDGIVCSSLVSHCIDPRIYDRRSPIDKIKDIFGWGRDMEELAGIDINQLILLWENNVLHINSLTEFISLLEKNDNFKTIVKFVKKLARKEGESEEAVWAVLLEFLLEETNKLNRHDLRLLKSFLPPDAKKQELRLKFAQTFENQSWWTQSTICY